METNHTPLPWAIKTTDGWPPEKHIVSSIGSVIATCNWDTKKEDIHPQKDTANAEYIVEACNNYPVLKQQNEELIEKYNKLSAYCNEVVDKYNAIINQQAC